MSQGDERAELRPPAPRRRRGYSTAAERMWSRFGKFRRR